MTVESLLPPGARTKAEQAIEQAVARPLPIEIGRLASPETAPDAFIPFLAWGSSTDLWDRSWSIEKKRAVVKAWWRLHRKKGTLDGIKEALRFFGAEVVAVRRPPDSTFPDPTLTRAERDRYLARFRQLRFYSFRSRGVASFGAYANSGYRLPALFPGGGFFPTFSDAAVRVGRRAYVYDPLTGVEVPVKQAQRVSVTDRRGAVTFEQVSLPGTSPFAVFVGRPIGRVFTMDTGARGRVYSVAIESEYQETKSRLHISGVLPSQQPIDIRPRKARVPGQRVIGQLFPSISAGGLEVIGRPADGARRTFLPPSTAGLRIYDQVFLFDRDRQPDKRSARTFLGSTRLGMPAYHARLTIETRGRIAPLAMQRFISGYFVKTDKRRLAQAIEATRISKALRDKVLVTAKTMRPAKAADGVPVGSIKVGTWLRDV